MSTNSSKFSPITKSITRHLDEEIDGSSDSPPPTTLYTLDELDLNELIADPSQINFQILSLLESGLLSFL